MMGKDKPKRADELLSELSRDPEYMRRREEQEAERRRKDDETQEAAGGVLDSLASTGVAVSSLDELTGRYAPLSSDVVEVLLEWLPRVEHRGVQEQLVRALGAAQEPFDGFRLVRLFEETDSEMLRWAIANTMAEAQPTGISDWVLEALTDSSHGRAREMLTLAAARLAPAERANDVLLGVLEDLPGHVAMALGECGGERALRALQEKVEEREGWMREETERAIGRIRRRLGNETSPP